LKNPDVPSSSDPTSAGRFALTALLLGNFVIGTSVFAPAGMLSEMAAGLNVGIGQASLLMTIGAVVLCLGSPLLSWATSRMDRRTLLVSLLAIIVAAHLAAALTDSFAAVLVLRLLMVAAAAPFTPQAASVVGLLVEPKRQPGAISYVFLGWSLAAAAGIPLMTAVGSRFGWQVSFLVVAVIAAVGCALLLWRLPRGLKTPPVDLRSWEFLFSNPLVLLLLLVTLLQMGGQFMVFTFIGPLLGTLAGANPDQIGIGFAIFGTAGFLGNIVASQIVARLAPFRTSLLFTSLVLIGLGLWSLSAGQIGWMLAGMIVWGLGFAAANSMQQARLAGAAPELAGSAVALNTSILYVGQALGTGTGSVLFVHGFFKSMGYCGVVVMLFGLAAILATRPRAE